MNKLVCLERLYFTSMLPCTQLERDVPYAHSLVEHGREQTPAEVLRVPRSSYEILGACFFQSERNYLQRACSGGLEDLVANHGNSASFLKVV